MRNFTLAVAPCRKQLLVLFQSETEFALLGMAAADQRSYRSLEAAQHSPLLILSNHHHQSEDFLSIFIAIFGMQENYMSEC